MGVSDKENEFRKQYISTNPLGRVGLPKDIAPAVVFLASDDSSWITGETFYVSGGITLIASESRIPPATVGRLHKRAGPFSFARSMRRVIIHACHFRQQYAKRSAPLCGFLSLLVSYASSAKALFPTQDSPQGRSVEWPIVSTNQAICLARWPICRSSATISSSIQIYSPDRHFLYGWHAAYKMYSVQATARRQHLHVFGDKDSEKTYSPDGTLLSEKSYDPRIR